MHLICPLYGLKLLFLLVYKLLWITPISELHLGKIIVFQGSSLSIFQGLPRLFKQVGRGQSTFWSQNSLIIFHKIPYSLIPIQPLSPSPVALKAKKSGHPGANGLFLLLSPFSSIVLQGKASEELLALVTRCAHNCPSYFTLNMATGFSFRALTTQLRAGCLAQRSPSQESTTYFLKSLL